MVREEGKSSSLMIPGSCSCSTCASSLWAVEKDLGYSVEQSIFASDIKESWSALVYWFLSMKDDLLQV